ncbi:MAG: hypothetical protein V7L27_05960 [Nostoc sp.]
MNFSPGDRIFQFDHGTLCPEVKFYCGGGRRSRKYAKFSRTVTVLG